MFDPAIGRVVKEDVGPTATSAERAATSRLAADLRMGDDGNASRSFVSIGVHRPVWCCARPVWDSKRTDMSAAMTALRALEDVKGSMTQE